MSCDSIADALVVDSSTATHQLAQLNRTSVSCVAVDADAPKYAGEVASTFIFNGDLVNVANGVHTFTVNNATSKDGLSYTDAFDRFMFRIGQDDNPMVFPMSSNYTRSLLHRNQSTGELYISPRAAGADKYRYSTNWGSSFSDWSTFTSENITVQKQPWEGTQTQQWDGDHVVVHYWSSKTGSSEHVQHADLDRESLPARRWPHAFVQGPWNQWGYDNGLSNAMTLTFNGSWQLDVVAEWPTESIVNVWGMNPDGYPDKSKAFGDVDGDNVLDWVPPDSLAKNVIHFPAHAGRYLGYRLMVNDGNYNYSYRPIGRFWIQVVVAILLALLPLVAAILCCVVFMRSFYKVKVNELGISEKVGLLEKVRLRLPGRKANRTSVANVSSDLGLFPATPTGGLGNALAADTGSPDRRTVLIATMEYEIEDWEIKIKIGGLGVMTSLMAKNLGMYSRNNRAFFKVIPTPMRCIQWLRSYTSRFADFANFNSAPKPNLGRSLCRRYRLPDRYHRTPYRYCRHGQDVPSRSANVSQHLLSVLNEFPRTTDTVSQA